MIIIAAVAAVFVISLLVAILLATFGILHEEYARSLSGSAPSLTAQLARRMLGYHSDPQPVPVQPVGRQPQPRRIRVPAGV